MPRPRKKKPELLNKHLPGARCSEAEFIIIKERANKLGLSVSEYIRRMALNGKVTIKQSQGLGSSFELVQQLKKIGTNVNQIAKNLNIFGDPVTADQKRVWLKLEKVLDNLLTTM